MNYTDQMQQTITLAAKPRRIISIVPSQTELLYDLGLDMEVIGVTKFCVHPESWFRNKTRIGGTKNLNIEKIISLQPDLILANKEENDEAQVAELRKLFPVWVSDIKNLDDALSMITSVGAMTGKAPAAEKIAFKIRDNFRAIPLQVNPPTAVFLIWNNPYMCAGNDTFIHEMMRYCGLHNCITQERYPNITLEEMIELKPEVIILSSEPFPFKKQHADTLMSKLPGTRVLLADGEMFSWYGSRLCKAPAYFRQLMAPAAVSV